MNDTLRQWKRDTVWYVIGCVTGAGVMIYVNSLVVPPTKPVVTVEQGRERSSGDYPASNPITHDTAPPLALEQQIAKAKADIEARFAQVERDNEARDARVEQRNKEFAFAQRKLAGVKTWDLKLGEGK